MLAIALFWTGGAAAALRKVRLALLNARLTDIRGFFAAPPTEPCSPLPHG